MSSHDRRRALGARKERRPHPVAPITVAESDVSAPQPLPPTGTGDTPVMFSVRVPASLRRRLKLAALESGLPVQQLAAEALEEECRRRRV